MNKKIESSDLDTWIKNLEPESNMSVLTADALITLKDLEDFVEHIKEVKADSVRFRLVRFDRNVNEPQLKKEKDNNFPIGCKWLHNNDKTQVAITMNGTTGFKQDDNYVMTAQDIIEGTTVWMLIPGGKDEGPTGHNPSPPKTPTGK